MTGEERRFADPEGKPANHVACTVEMTNLTTLCKRDRNDLIDPLKFVLIDDVAIVDEIQMMRDPQRGWAWTRALLGKFIISFKNRSMDFDQVYKRKRFISVANLRLSDSFKI